MSGIYDEIVEIIAEVLGVSTQEISEDTAIGDLPEWDSLHHIQIISKIENHFGIRFTPDVMMELEDVNDIVDATETRMGK